MLQQCCYGKAIVVAGLIAVFANGASGTIVIETLPVGEPCNAPDTRYDPAGFGGVGYAFNIGKYEVTAGQYTAFLNAVAATDTYGLYSTNMANPDGIFRGANIQRSGSSGGFTYSVAADWADRPVNYVSWGDAARFANWLHNGQPTGPQGLSTTEDGSYFLDGATSNEALLAVTRKADATWAIPTEDEWYKAAYHKNDGVTGNYWDYPTSSNNMPSNVLGNPTDPRNNATFYNNGYSIGSPYYRTEVGEHENSDSPYGTFDQGGNLWERNETVLGSYRGVRGGSLIDNDGYLRASVRGFASAGAEGYYNGFRLSLVPEPSCLAMLAFAGVGMLRRRTGSRR